MFYISSLEKRKKQCMHLCRRCRLLYDRYNTAVCLFCWWGKYCNKRVVVLVVLMERSKSQCNVQHTIYVNELQYFAITVLNLRVLSKQRICTLHVARIETRCFSNAKPKARSRQFPIRGERVRLILERSRAEEFRKKPLCFESC